MHSFLDRVQLELERSKEVEPLFLNVQPSPSELELALRFIFALNIMQINKERNQRNCKTKHKGALLKNGSLVSLNFLRLKTIKHKKNKTKKNLIDKFIKKL